MTKIKMIRVHKKAMEWVSTIALTFVLFACSAIAQSPAASSSGTAATGQGLPHKEVAKSSSKSAGGGAASDSEIVAAKASGKVWVNTDSGVYHKSGRWYGKTKAGKFMTESEAKAAGYKATKKQ